MREKREPRRSFPGAFDGDVLQVVSHQLCDLQRTILRRICSVFIAIFLSLRTY